MERQYYVYIVTNIHHTTLYTGVTNNIIRRMYEHRNGLVDGFTKKYKLKKLVYFEQCSDVINAIQREKQIKGGSRAKKLKLIVSSNPEWRDLYEELL